MLSWYLGTSVSGKMLALPCPWSRVFLINSSLFADTCPRGCYLLDLLVLPPQSSSLGAMSFVESPLPHGIGLVKPTMGLNGLCSVLSLASVRVHWLHWSLFPEMCPFPSHLHVQGRMVVSLPRIMVKSYCSEYLDTRCVTYASYLIISFIFFICKMREECRQ